MKEYTTFLTKDLDLSFPMTWDFGTRILNCCLHTVCRSSVDLNTTISGGTPWNIQEQGQRRHWPTSIGRARMESRLLHNNTVFFIFRFLSNTQPSLPPINAAFVKLRSNIILLSRVLCSHLACVCPPASGTRRWRVPGSGPLQTLSVSTWNLSFRASYRASLEPTPRPWSPRCCCWRTPSAVPAPCSAAAPPVLQWAAAGRAAPGAGVWCPHPRPRTAPAAGRVICIHQCSLYLLGQFCHCWLLIPSKQ